MRSRLDPVELRLSGEIYETARMQGFFGAIRDSMPDFWGRRVIERNTGFTELTEFDYLMQGPRRPRRGARFRHARRAPRSAAQVQPHAESCRAPESG